MASTVIIEVQNGTTKHSESISIAKDSAKASELRQLIRLQLDRRKILSLSESSRFELSSEGKEFDRDSIISLSSNVANRETILQFLKSENVKSPLPPPPRNVARKWQTLPSTSRVSEFEPNQNINLESSGSAAPAPPPPRDPNKRPHQLLNISKNQDGPVSCSFVKSPQQLTMGMGTPVTPPRNPDRSFQGTDEDRTADDGRNNLASIGPSTKPAAPNQRNPWRTLGSNTGMRGVTGRGIAGNYGSSEAQGGIRVPQENVESVDYSVEMAEPKNKNIKHVFDGMKKWTSTPNMMGKTTHLYESATCGDSGNVTDKSPRTFSTIAKPLKDIVIRARNNVGHVVAHARKSALDHLESRRGSSMDRMSMPYQHPDNITSRPRRTTDPSSMEKTSIKNRAPRRDMPALPPPWRRTGDFRHKQDELFDEVVKDIVPSSIQKTTTATKQETKPIDEKRVEVDHHLSVSEEDRMRRALSIEVNQAQLKQEAEALHNIIAQREKQLSADFWKVESSNGESSLTSVRKELGISKRVPKTTNRLSTRIRDIEQFFTEEEKLEMQLAGDEDQTVVDTDREFNNLLDGFAKS